MTLIFTMMMGGMLMVDPYFSGFVDSRRSGGGYRRKGGYAFGWGRGYGEEVVEPEPERWIVRYIDNARDY